MGRLELHEKLCEVLGSRNVYFQPPSSMYLKYPCIVYKLDRKDTLPADNTKYLKNNSYQTTIIDKNPDSNIHNLIADLPYSRFVSAYEADNLNHWVYSIYY